MLIGSIVYEETINMSKQPTQNTTSIKDNEVKNNDVKNDVVKDEENESKQETTNDDEFVGEEEQETSKEDNTKSKDEKAIQLAKDEWGDDDTVTFSVEKKKDTKYYVAVKSAATVLQWYEVDTDTWEISEY